MKNMSAVVDVLLKSHAKADCLNKVLDPAYTKYSCNKKQFTATCKRLEALCDIFLSSNCVVERKMAIPAGYKWRAEEDFARSKSEI